MSKRVSAGLGVFFLGTLLTACSDDPSSEEIEAAGLQATNGPKQTLACYDYNGGQVLKKDFGKGSVDFGQVGVEAKNDNGKRTAYVSGGGGCYHEKYHVDPKDKANDAVLGDAYNKASYYAAITNGVDQVMVYGKFSDMSEDTNHGTVKLSLSTPDGVKVREVQSRGLHVIISQNEGEMSEQLREAVTPETTGPEVTSPSPM
ncbi:MAG: hypothetical protein H6861_08220 [Rhodospirillales bacterium]|nr:hypothetical protein [Rhodospirillales bacterium]